MQCNDHSNEYLVKSKHHIEVNITLLSGCLKLFLKCVKLSQLWSHRIYTGNNDQVFAQMLTGEKKTWTADTLLDHFQRTDRITTSIVTESHVALMVFLANIHTVHGCQ